MRTTYNFSVLIQELACTPDYLTLSCQQPILFAITSTFPQQTYIPYTKHCPSHKRLLYKLSSIFKQRP